MAFLGSITNLNNAMKIPKPPNKLNWWMFDLDNIQLISLTTVPENVADTKSIEHVSISVPGLGYKPMLFSGIDNKKISFTIRVIARNQVVGNQLYLQQFDSLRRPRVGLFSVFAEDEAFVPNPQVLYHYGSGSTLPLVYYVTKIDMSHSKYNNWGYPQVTDVSIELTLNENHLINMAEDVARKVAMVLGTIQSGTTLKSGLSGGKTRNPY